MAIYSFKRQQQTLSLDPDIKTLPHFHSLSCQSLHTVGRKEVFTIIQPCHRHFGRSTLRPLGDLHHHAVRAPLHHLNHTEEHFWIHYTLREKQSHTTFEPKHATCLSSYYLCACCSAYQADKLCWPSLSHHSSPCQYE